MKKLLGVFVVITSLLVLSSTVSAEEAFKDINGHWAEEEILQMANEGIVKGVPGGNFEPNQEISRAEFIAILTRVFDFEESKSDFSDVNEGDWFYKSVSKGFNEGIVSGFPNGTFGPKQNVTRQDIAVFIDRAIKKNGDFSKLAKLEFNDENDIFHYAKDSIRTMVAYNLMQGKGNNKVAPLDNANRAESTVMIYRMKELLSRESNPEPSEPEEPSDPEPSDPEPSEPEEPSDPEPSDPEPSEPEEPSDPEPSDPEPSEPEEPSDKHYTEMTLEELKEVYGPYTLVERIDGYAPGVGITTRDLMDRYYDKLNNPVYDVPDPETYMKEKEKSLQSLNGHYSTWYPKYEVISYNGMPFVESPLYDGDYILPFKSNQADRLSILPRSPAKGEILIDLHTYSEGFAIYQHDNVGVGYLGETMYQKNGVWMVDSHSLFNRFGDVSTGAESQTIEYKNRTVEVTNGKTLIKVNGSQKNLQTSVEKKNDTLFVPLREVANELGLYTREYKLELGRLEVATYELKADFVRN
ncbi:S-layer homology domain-containing protein [Halobacillus litoralis]|nr:S-layer homology domain-containing protein [Halobacillus litoralis]